MRKTPKTIRTGIFKNCQKCSIQFYVKKHEIPTAKFCSHKCAGDSARHKFKGNCLICGNEFEFIACRSDKAKYCSRPCYYKAMRKKGSVTFKCHHCEKQYKGSPSRIGKSKFCSIKCINKESHKTFNPTFNTVRNAMLRRGQLESCERCGYMECKKILGVHHKDRNSKNNKRENLEVLCPNCHSLEHQKHIAHGSKVKN